MGVAGDRSEVPPAGARSESGLATIAVSEGDPSCGTLSKELLRVMLGVKLGVMLGVMLGDWA